MITYDSCFDSFLSKYGGTKKEWKRKLGSLVKRCQARTNYPPWFRARVIKAYTLSVKGTGKRTADSIAKEFDISRDTLYRWLKAWAETDKYMYCSTKL